MSLSAKLKSILNAFSDSQPALNDRDKPHATSAVKLGDLIDAAEASAVTSAQAYTPTTTTDWTGADPTTVQEALDRLAAALGPIA